jgi:hypothetical protein
MHSAPETACAKLMREAPVASVHNTMMSHGADGSRTKL